MRTSLIALVLGALLLSACQTARRARPATRVVEPAAPVATPTEPAPRRLRYYDTKDLPITNGILVVRASRERLKAIDKHLSGIRRALREQEAEDARLPPDPAKAVASGLVVQIHAIQDLATQHTAQAIRARVIDGLGAEMAEDTLIRIQGETVLVVKASPEIQDRIAEILDGLRGAK